MKKIIVFIASLAMSSISFAALFARDLDGNLSNGHEGVYDDVLGITWLADANAGGLMTWQDANNWAANFAINGFADWRLPSLIPVNGTNFQVDFSSGRIFDGSQDASYNVGQVGSASQGFLGSEFAYHFYINLGAEAQTNVDGSYNFPSSGIANASNVANLALFSNIQGFAYWLGLEYSGDTTAAWDFFVNDGFQDISGKGNLFAAWAVHNGDIGTVVPIPAAIWLFGTALVSLLGFQKINKEV